MSSSSDGKTSRERALEALERFKNPIGFDDWKSAVEVDMDTLRDATVDYQRHRRYVKAIDEMFNDEKSEFYKFMDDHLAELTEGLYGEERDRIEFDANLDGAKTYIVTRVQSRKLKWDAEELESRLPRDMARKAVKRTREISDWESFVDVLKAHGVHASEVLPLLTVHRTVDEPNVDRMVEIGALSMDDLKGTFELVEGKPYYKVTERDSQTTVSDMVGKKKRGTKKKK